VAPAPEGRTPGSIRRLGEPRPAVVRAAEADGRPLSVDGEAVEAVVETWLLEDRWWTERPLRRRMWEVVTARGRAVVVHRDLVDGSWWRSR
jgi:CO dehydrogenase/acetyl-CoA synthase delta subunit